MNQPIKHRVLAIAPSTRGLGFAVLEGQNTLVDWGLKVVKGDKNAQCLLKLKEMIKDYHPDALVLENYSAKGSRRSPRVRKLGQEVLVLARSHKIKVWLYSNEEVMGTFFTEADEGTKHAVAEIVAKRFPEELGARLPPKRRAWDTEDAKMPFFDAVALALVFRLNEEERTK